MRWYRSFDLVTSEDVNNEHVVRIHSASHSVVSGNLAGLFRYTYALIIRNVSSSDNGYYWCQIVANETHFSSSPYVNLSVNTSSTSYRDIPPCPSPASVNYENPVCATILNETGDLRSTTNSRIVSPTAASHYNIMSNSLSSTAFSLNFHLPSTERASNQGICMTRPDVEHLEFVTCLGVTIPTAGFVLILIILLICCAGIYVCQRKKAKHEGKQKQIYLALMTLLYHIQLVL